MCEACDAAHLPLLLFQNLGQDLHRRINFSLTDDVRRQEPEYNIVRAVDQQAFSKTIVSRIEIAIDPSTPTVFEKKKNISQEQTASL